LINYFKEALNGRGKVFATDMQLTAPALVDADVAIQVPGIYEPNYIEVLKEILKKEKIDLVISLNDLELPILSQSKKELEQFGAKVVISSPEAITTSFDKWETFKFLENIGLKSPKTFIVLEKALLAIEKCELSFPVVIKPRWGSASIAVDFAENLNELKLAYQLQLIRIKRSILSNVSKEDIEHSILIQEKISGTEYGMDILNDFDGKYQGTFVREKLSMRSGETDKAVSVFHEKFNELGRKIGTQLQHVGNLDCDVFEHNNELYVLELNPRFGGGYPFSHEAGMDTAGAYIAWMNGEMGIEKQNNYKEGVMFSKCDRLLKIK
jgi:carbamoyl-phosphate synthase large subunit